MQHQSIDYYYTTSESVAEGVFIYTDIPYVTFVGPTGTHYYAFDVSALGPYYDELIENSYDVTFGNFIYSYQLIGS